MPDKLPNNPSTWIRYDLPASLSVFFVALPLCLGVALASGAPLASGLLAGAIGGIVVGLLSSSHASVSGPAAGMVAVVLTCYEQLGSIPAFGMALAVAGLIQILAGYLRIGFISAYIPKNIIQGLLTAIGIILILKQIPHAVGLDKSYEGDFSFFQKDGENTFSEIWNATSFFTPGALILSITSVFFLVAWDKTPLRKLVFFPPSLFVVIFGIGANTLLSFYFPDLAIGEEHMVHLPSIHNGDQLVILPDPGALLRSKTWISAVTIAIVASLETLINIEATDNLDPYRRGTPPNKELFAQGTGNLISGLIGGIPITSVVVRSSVNLQAGARSKASTILHGVWLLVGFFFLSGVLNKIPLSVLAAILMMAGYKLTKVEVFTSMYKKGLSQFIPFLVTCLAIVFTDLLTGIIIGSGVSIIFLLKSNLENPFMVVEERKHIGETMRITLPNQVSFLNKARILKQLRKIPKKEKVIIDATQTHYIDPDVVEIFQDFMNTEAKQKGIQLNILGMEALGEGRDHIEFTGVLNKEAQQNLHPAEILNLLKEGNKRFMEGNPSHKYFGQQILATSDNQSPMAVVVSCIDSRTSPELILDAGIGDLISIRIAGNIITDSIVGSVEIACAEIGVNLVVVMGHSNCGAVTQAMLGNERGNIKWISSEIEPSVIQAGLREPERAEITPGFINQVSMLNLRHSVLKLKRLSPFLEAGIKKGQIGLVAGFYDTTTGKVTFDKMEYSGSTYIVPPSETTDIATDTV